jgi:hypothetical protein
LAFSRHCTTLVVRDHLTYGVRTAVYYQRALSKYLSKIAHSEPAVATDVSVWPLASPRRRSDTSGLGANWKRP